MTDSTLNIDYVLKLNQIMTYLGLSSMNKLRILLDVSPSTWNGYMSKRFQPGINILSRLLVIIPNFNTRWWCLDEGTMLIDNPQMDATEYKDKIMDLQDRLLWAHKELEKYTDKHKIIIEVISSTDHNFKITSSTNKD